MDEQRFLNACQMREENKFSEAYEEFLKIAETTEDRIDKAGALLYAGMTLKLLERYEDAKCQFIAARTVAAEYLSPNSSVDERVGHLELYLDFEDADLYWKQGENEEALTRLSNFFETYAERMREPEFRPIYESVQARRAFILADLNRWKEAMPILEAARSFTEYKEGIAFYLGHCYLAAHDYSRSEERLIEALRLGLPHSLDYRAHCELGMAYYSLEEYAKAKLEFELGARKADPSYIKQSQIWKWLEVTCLKLGLKDEARYYACLSKPS
jgi:tetratricopeptide (TPR) repeat protein